MYPKQAQLATGDQTREKGWKVLHRHSKDNLAMNWGSLYNGLLGEWKTNDAQVS